MTLAGMSAPLQSRLGVGLCPLPDSRGSDSGVLIDLTLTLARQTDMKEYHHANHAD
jgi:hypothetical protein